MIDEDPFAPGYLFAPSTRYRNYTRLDATMLSDETEWAVGRLGEPAKGLAAAR